MWSSKTLIATLTIVASLCATSAGANAAANGSATVVPPAARVGGKTYGQWSGAQWAWELQVPTSPTNDQVIVPNAGTAAHPEAVDCTLRQSGNVWFLAGTTFFQNYTTAYRSCTIPTGKFLFFPLIDAWQDNLNCPGLPPLTATADELRAAVSAQIDQIIAGSLQATVDGRTVQGLTDGRTAFRAQADAFSYSLPANNELGSAFCGESFPAGTTPPPPGAFADGVYVMLPPLSVGTHQLAFTPRSRAVRPKTCTTRLPFPHSTKFVPPMRHDAALIEGPPPERAS